MYKIYLILIVFFPMLAQNVCDELLEMKNDIYGFHVSDLSDEQKEEKSKELDKFWSFVKNDVDEHIRCLVNLIKEEEKDGYFLYDASALLFSIDKDKVFREETVQGFVKADVEQIQLQGYLYHVFMLNRENIDTSLMARMMFSTKRDKIFLRKHFLNLDRMMFGILIYGSINDEIATDRLIDNIKQSNVTSVVETSALLLKIINTDQGNNFVDSLITNQLLSDSIVSKIKKTTDTSKIKIPPEIEEIYDREEILEKLSWVPFNTEKKWYGVTGDKSLARSVYENLNSGDINILREARNRTIYSLSDEALHEYFAVTYLISMLKSK